MVIKVSDSDFSAFLACETKGFFRAAKTTPTDSEFADHHVRMTAYFRQHQLVVLRNKYTSGICPDLTPILDAFDQTRAQILFDCSIVTDQIATVIHGIECLSGANDASGRQYAPLRFVAAERVTTNDRLLLAFDALAIGIHLGQSPSFGRLVYGKNCSVCTVKLTTELLQKAQSRVDELTSMMTAPNPILNKHCADCEFQSHCLQNAQETDDLSLLSGMPDAERRQLHQKGIFTVTQLSYTFRVRRNRKTPNSSHRRHRALTALAIREGQTYILGKPSFDTGATPVFIDVECVPDRAFYYLIGMCHYERGALVYQSFWADDLQHEQHIWCDFLAALRTIENPTIVHYGSFEKEVLQTLNSRYPNPQLDEFVIQLIDGSRNVLSAIFMSVYFPTRSNSLKDIATYLGFQWTCSMPSGARSVVWRTEWEDTREPQIKQNLLTYNAEDCGALVCVVDAVVRLGSNSADQSAVSASVSADSLSLWKKEFAVPEFDVINKASYWDHQQHQIYVKSTRCPRALHKPRGGRQQRNKHVRIIEASSPTSCPSCGSERFYKRSTKSRAVVDIRFTDSGLSRRLYRYVARTFKCRMCSTTLETKVGSWPKHKYGQGLTAYVIYHLVELGLLQRSIARSMGELLGFKMSQGAPNYIKSLAAKYYSDGYAAIKNRLVGEKVIYADETTVKLKGGRKAYVWVLTSLDEVYFFFNDSRECQKIHELLKDFRGVLVTDFYGGYESLPCPQQKCLIHLMRNLNDDLLKEPFNLQLRRLSTDFAELLGPMIATIDEHGLKRAFLMPHQLFVDAFFDRLASTKSESDVFLQYKDRFAKSRNKLFTFLAHDDVSWHNNYAEHAIKEFARLRKSIEGLNGQEGISEYLVLLSICVTCKYKGVGVLDFLRSGYDDVSKFIENQLQDKTGAKSKEDSTSDRPISGTFVLRDTFTTTE